MSNGISFQDGIYVGQARLRKAMCDLLDAEAEDHKYNEAVRGYLQDLRRKVEKL